MKKFDGLGRSLNASEQKLVMGGKTDDVGCSATVNCGGGASVSCSGASCVINRDRFGNPEGVTCDSSSSCCS